jgi:citrate lyase subunit beta/citryl-CoA lyase
MPFNRSFLFAPGNHARRSEKAFMIGADAVILDLEDAVPPAEKPAARPMVAEALARPRACRGYVRVNAMSTPWCYADLVGTVGPGVDGIVVPKVESAADLHAIDWLVANLERERGIEPGTLDILPIVETAAGIQRIDRILQARSLRPYSGRWRVRRVAFGGVDYARDLELRPSLDEPELADARARVVLASRGAGLEPPIDSPWLHFKDAEGFARSLDRSRRHGFQGRICIHPDQVAVVNKAYSPSAEEIAMAGRIVAAFREAEARGSAAIQVDGQMIDYPVVHQAERLLESVRAAEQ